MGGFFGVLLLPLFLLFIPLLCALFGNEAKRDFLVIIKPKQELFSKPLNSAKKTKEKARKKTTLSPINKRKFKERKPRKKPTKKPKYKNNT